MPSKQKTINKLISSVLNSNTYEVSEFMKKNLDFDHSAKIYKGETLLSLSAKMLAEESKKAPGSSNLEGAKDIFYILLYNEPNFEDKAPEKNNAINSVNSMGESALYILSKNYNENLKDVIEDIIFDINRVVDDEEDQIDPGINLNDLLFGAAKAKNGELLSKAIDDLQLDINAEDANSTNALMYACYSGNKDNVMKILDYKSKTEPEDLENFVNAKNAYGENAVTLIMQNSWNDTAPAPGVRKFIISKLLESGFDMDSTNDNGDTVLMQLIRPNVIDQKVIGILLNEEITTNINQQNNQGDTALTLACGYNKPYVVDRILERDDICVGISNSKGRDALEAAKMHGIDSHVYNSVSVYKISSELDLDLDPNFMYGVYYDFPEIVQAEEFGNRSNSGLVGDADQSDGVELI